MTDNKRNRSEAAPPSLTSSDRGNHHPQTVPYVNATGSSSPTSGVNPASAAASRVTCGKNLLLRISNRNRQRKKRKKDRVERVYNKNYSGPMGAPTFDATGIAHKKQKGPSSSSCLILGMKRTDTFSLEMKMSDIDVKDAARRDIKIESPAHYLLKLHEEGWAELPDARDEARARMVEKIGGCHVFCVSNYLSATMPSPRNHLNASFSSKGFIKEFSLFRGLTFRQIVLDWFYSPVGWTGDRWKPFFFEMVLPYFATFLENNHADDDGLLCKLPCAIFLPSNDHVLAEIFASSWFAPPPEHRGPFDVSLLTKVEAQKQNILCRATAAIPNDIMSLLGKVGDQFDYSLTWHKRLLDRCDHRFHPENIEKWVAELLSKRSPKDIVYVKLSPAMRSKNSSSTMSSVADVSTSVI